MAASQDTAAKTFTFTVTSIDDPLFAIGGASVDGVPHTSGDTDGTPNNSGDTDGIPNASLAILASSIVVVVLLIVVGVWYFKKPA